QFDLMSDVFPLVHFADEPRNETEQKSSAAAKSWCNRQHRNRRQPDQPPNRMQAGTEIQQCGRDETGSDDEKENLKFQRELSCVCDKHRIHLQRTSYTS